MPFGWFNFSIYEFKHCFTYTFNHFTDNIVKHQCYPWGTFSNQWDGRKPPMWTRRRAFPRLSLPNPKSAPQYQVCAPCLHWAVNHPEKRSVWPTWWGNVNQKRFNNARRFNYARRRARFCLRWCINVASLDMSTQFLGSTELFLWEIYIECNKPE